MNCSVAKKEFEYAGLTEDKRGQIYKCRRGHKHKVYSECQLSLLEENGCPQCLRTGLYWSTKRR